MTEDITEMRPDQPTPRSASEASATAIDVPESGTRTHDRSGPSGLLAWALVAVAAVGLLASTPPSAGPDEPVHQVSAWYLSEHLFPPSSTVSYSVPASLWVNPCFAGNASTTASCMAPRYMNSGTVSTSSVVTYPPPYYWAVGAGERLGALAGNQYADVGGRLASIVLNFGALLLLSLYMRHRNAMWGSFLLLLSTPMAVFLGIVVNPSGWEITCGLVMAVALSQAAWRPASVGVQASHKATTAILLFASIALSLARPIGFVWASGLIVSALALAPAADRRASILRVVPPAIPGIVLGLAWYLTHPTLSTSQPVESGTLPHLATWFADSLLSFPEYLRHMFGVLGWLDTPEPGLLLLVSIAAWGVLLTRLPSIGLAAKVCGIGGIFLLPAVISAIGWASYPAWWQGRYTMPFACGFVLLLLLRSGHLIPRMVSIVSGISVFALGLMVWVNEVRYGFGVDAVDLPATLANPALSSLRLAVSAVVGAFLLLVSGYLLVQAWRMRPDLISAAAQDGSVASSALAPSDTRSDAGAVL